MGFADQLIRYAGLFGRKLSDDPLEQRDVGFIHAEMHPLGRMLETWYAPEVMGLEHVPAEGRVLVVGQHNGGQLAPDMFITMVGFWRRFGVERAAYGLAHDMVFRLPGMGRWIAKLGAVPARPAHAQTLLERDAAVLVYPGGDVDAFKPYARRHVIDFAGRKGFARIAIRTGAPIVPVVSVGAHEIFRVLTDGREIVKALGLKQIARVEVLPIALALPFGLWVGPLTPYVPMPTRIRVKALPPIELGLPASAADDPQAVDAAVARVQSAMQAGIDALAAEGGYGPKARMEIVAREGR